MACFGPLGSFLLALPVVYLAFFTRRTHSWLFQFIVEPGYFFRMWLSSPPVPILHYCRDFFLHWCRSLHLHLVIFRTFVLAYFFRLFRSPWVSVLSSRVSEASLRLVSSISSLREQTSQMLLNTTDPVIHPYEASLGTESQLFSWPSEFILPPALLSTFVLHPAHTVFHQRVPLKTELFLQAGSLDALVSTSKNN